MKKKELKSKLKKIGIQVGYLITAIGLYHYLDFRFLVVLLLTYIIYKKHGKD